MNRASAKGTSLVLAAIATRSGGTCALAAVLLLVVGGCVNQTHEVRTYRDVVDAGVQHPRPYKSGEPLSLVRALALANEDNEQISLQGESYLQSLIAKDRAVSQFLPTVAFQPDFTIEQAPKNGTTSAGADVSPQVAASAGGFVEGSQVWHRFEAPVVATENLSFVSYPNIESAGQTVVQQRQLLLDAQATVLLDVAQTYYQVLRSEAQVVVLTNSLKVQQARLADSQSRYRNHLALALEVSQTEAQVASTTATLTQAQSDVRNGRHMLAFLIGVSEVDGPLLDEVVVPAQLGSADEFREKAAATRQDLLAAYAAVKASRYSVDAAIAEYYPSVSINVAGFLYREYFSSASKWDAILIANLPIFAAGTIEEDVRNAWSKLRQALLYQQELKRQIDRDVQIAYDNLTTSDTTLADLRQEVKAAQDALDQSQQLFKNGLAIYLDVLTAQDTLLNSQLDYTNEEFDRSVFYLDLLRITGQLNPNTPRAWRAGTTRLVPSATTLPTDY